MIGWLLETIMLDMQRRNKFQEMSAEIYRNEIFFASVTLYFATPSTVESQSSANVTVTGQVSSQANASPAVSLTSRGERLTHRRDLVGDGFDDSLTCTFVKGKTAFVIQGAEDLLMNSLVRFSRLAYDRKTAPRYAFDDPSGNVEVIGAPTGVHKPYAVGRELLICLLEILEWEYSQRKTTSLFPTVKVALLKRIGITEQYVGRIDVSMPS